MKIEVHRHPGTPFETNTIEVVPRAVGREGCVVEPDAAATVTLREVFNGVTLITEDGEVLVVNMRDSGFEMAYQSVGENTIFVDAKAGHLAHSDEAAEPQLGYATNRQLIEELQARWSTGSTHPEYSTVRSTCPTPSDYFPDDEVESAKRRWREVWR